MKSRLRSCLLAMSAGALLLATAPAQAQDKKLEFYAGYAYLHSDDGSLNGLRFSPAYRLKGALSLVGDFSAEFGKLADTDTTLTSFLGGLRARKAFGTTAIFIHALAGGVRTSSSITPFQGVSISVNDTGIAFDGGGGLDFKLSHFKLRLGADYLRREVDIGGGKTANEDNIRATVGFVF